MPDSSSVASRGRGQQGAKCQPGSNAAQAGGGRRGAPPCIGMAKAGISTMDSTLKAGQGISRPGLKSHPGIATDLILT